MTDVSNKVLVADAEGVGLLPSIREGHREDIHCFAVKDYYSGEKHVFYDNYDQRINPVFLGEKYEDFFKTGDLEEGKRWLEQCAVLIMHNVAGFDELMLEKAMGKMDRDHLAPSGHDLFPFKTADTLVMSNFLNPERKLPHAAYMYGKGNIGPHTIEAYGLAMGRHKPVQEDWSSLTVDVIHRCSEDTEIGEYAFNTLMNEWDQQLDRTNKTTGRSILEAYRVEFRMAKAMARQRERGFAIDVALIDKLLGEMDQELSRTEEQFRKHMPRRIKKTKDKEESVEKNTACVLAHSGAKASVDYENYMLNGDCRSSYATSIWSLTKKDGTYTAAVSKYIPEAIGSPRDYISAGKPPPVAGPFTPLIWEDIPLGNRDEVKQILHKHGWIGVTFNVKETLYMEENDGELPNPWAGKVDDESLEQWEKSGHNVPEWCKGIARWYVISSRRTQLLNKDDPEYFRKNGKWPKHPGGVGCRGILPRAVCRDDGEWHLKTSQDYFEKNNKWPTSGHWRVPAEAFPCATNTSRMRHKVVVNIPARGLYGKEMRRVFIAPKGKKLLGCDGSGLELRMLAHYMGDEEYIDIVVNKDVHSYNANKAGFRTEDSTTHFSSARDMEKKFIFMWLYGSAIPNLARCMGMEREVMGACVKMFKQELPMLSILIKGVQKAAKMRRYLMALDSRWIRIRVKGRTVAIHTALNALLQTAGSLVIKYAHVRAEDMYVEEGLIERYEDFPILAHQHDEAQNEIDEDEVEYMQYSIPLDKSSWKEEEKRQHVDKEGRIWSAPIKVGELDGKAVIERRFHILGHCYCKALEWAGEFFGLRCPTAGEYKIGDNWEETH